MAVTSQNKVQFYIIVCWKDFKYHKLFYISITLQQLHSKFKYVVTDDEFQLFFFFKQDFGQTQEWAGAGMVHVVVTSEFARSESSML